MKPFRYFFVLTLLWLVLPVSGQVTYNFETNAVSNCWIFKEIEVAPKKVTPISGQASGITRALNVDPSSNAVYVASPWIRLSAGNITFKTRLTDGSTGSQNSRGYKVSYIEYNATSGTTFTDVQFQQIYTYSYSPIATDLRTVTVPVPASIAGNGKSYRIVIGFFGLGGSAQSVIDDISIPGLYNSDMTNNCLPLVTVVDADSDGVPDASDAYPNDPSRAFNNYFPSASGFATLLFEDLWPQKGDYDFNDLVLGYRINTVTNASDKVVNQVYTFKVRAIGAGLHNGFGFQIGSVAPSAVVSVSGTEAGSGFSLLSSGLEAGQSKA
ncbi:MAG: LruC domain-containing protein, partial [Bacteroidales bacterium]